MGGAVRYAFGFPFAAVVTVALFLLMRFLVIPEDFELPEETDSVNINITRQIQEEQAAFQREFTRPQQLNEPPPPPPSMQQRTSKPNLAGVSGDLPDFGTDLDLGNLNFNPDRDAQPLVRIEPRYPDRALSRGIEGWVLVQFNVTPEGDTFDCEVIEGEPPRMFDRAACRAVQNWKYQPKMEDGEPVPRYGVQTQFTFNLAED